MRSWKFLVLFLASTLSFASQPDRIAGTIDSSQMVALQNHVSPLAQSRYEQGLIESSYPLSVTMLFTPTAAQHAALQTLLADQQDPKSVNFHKWLTPEQYASRFGLSPNDVDKVTAWLKSQGFKVLYTARGRDSISFSGDASQVQTAFRTEIHRYEVNGERHFSNSTSPMIPAALSGIVGGFRGLHNFVPKGMSKLHDPGSALLHPDFTSSQAFTFLAPGDIATTYNINPLYQAATPIDGSGQNMVVVGQSDVYLADLNFFRTDFGFSTISGCTTSSANVITACDTTNFQLVIPANSGAPGVNAGDLGESDLDIEWSGSVARNAKIIFVTSDFNSGGVFNSVYWAIDNNLAPVMSISYGLCEALSTPPSLPTQDLEFQKGASFGISIFASSGDDGAATCDAFFGNSVAQYGLSVSYPASSPWVTAVGGTEFNEGSGTYWNTTNDAHGGSAQRYIPELAWNDTVLVGTLDATGGGPSNCANGTSTTVVGGVLFVVCTAPPNGGFAKPSYQTALTPSDGVRDVPDISFSASNANDPYVVCMPQSELGGTVSTSSCVTSIDSALVTYNSAFGGTSASSPVAAGMAALLNQYLGANGLGNINKQLYKLFGTNPSAFHDILAGTSSTGTGDTSDNIVPCAGATPSFEPVPLQCPAAKNTNGTFGYSAGPGYDLATGLGSIDFNALFTAWPASRTGSSVTISPSANSVNQGSSVTFTATVSPSTAVGTVSFSNTNNGSTTVLGTATLNNPTTLAAGTATLSTASLPGGSNSVTATFEGDASDNASTSAPAVVTVIAPYTLSASPSTFNIPAGQTATSTITITPASGFTGTVNFNPTTSPPGGCTAGLPAGALCSFNQTSPSTFTLTITTAANMALTSGAITVTGTSGSTVETTTVNLTVTTTNQSFTLTTTATTFPVAVGQTATVNVTVANPSTGGGSPIPFVGTTTALPLTYTCTGVPALPAAEIAFQVSPGNGQPTNVTGVTISLKTTPVTAQLRPLSGSRIFYALLLPGLFGIAFVAGSRTRGMRLLSLIVVLGFSTMWMGACGGGGGSNTQKNPGTPPGDYVVTISATTGGSVPLTNASAPLTFTLHVQ
ncbi:MAG TPA: protease pro-enzyme activation domain-containing protein [Candidatus Acidoferrum sp.]|jgi:subtilase family serine protease|nr:protease pro-enzyme activation domain-containing protein [Candidatus Acidoferrum sp.]